MTDHTTSTDPRAAPTKARRIGVVSLIAAYVFGLAALLSIMVTPGRLTASLLLAAPFLALSFVFLILGLKKIRQAEQQQAPSTAPPYRNCPWLIAIVALCLILPLSLQWILPPRWQPVLDVKNMGTNAVTLVFRGEAFVSQPGETWHMRFYVGDTLTIRANESVDAPSLTVTLPERNPKPWTLNPIAQRYTAEVNADDPENIRFENRRFEEISAPPSASEPWP